MGSSSRFPFARLRSRATSVKQQSQQDRKACPADQFQREEQLTFRFAGRNKRKHDPQQHSLTLPKGAGHSDRQLQLPTVQLPGATATEIATPLGTLIQFDRGGIDYTIVGSVTKATAEAAARGL